MRKLLLFITAFIAVSSTTCIKLFAEGKIGQKVLMLQKQNVFSKQVNPLKLSASQFDEQSENILRSYTLLDLSGDVINIVNTQPDYLRITVPIDKGHNSFTVLLFKENISPNGFKMETSDGNIYNPEKKPVNYRGIVEGNPSSVSAFTFAEEEVMGLISNGGGNYVIGKLEGNTSAKHIIYNDADVIPAFNFHCASNTISAPVLNYKDGNLPTVQSANCVNWYWEIDYDVFTGKGSLVNVNTYVNGIFNQVSTLYANDGMSITLQTVYVWTSTDPYTGPSTSDFLNQFGSYRTSFSGDLANLIGYAGGGGVAYVNGICASTAYRMGYCGISSSYQTVPTYSWTVEVVAHEEGHLFGSSHTHDCKWNGNNTRIDNCGPAAGYNSGTCAAGPIPTKGTIMSYCHLSPNPGIDLSLGFGPQPTALMLNKVNTATCLTACSGCATPAQPGTISGNTSVCSSTSQTYTITAVSGATSYTWTLPSGWSGSSTTNSITTTAGSAGGTITVKANNGCGSSAVRSLTVSTTTTVPAKPGLITGSSTACANQQGVPYSIVAVGGATSYKWIVPAGAHVSDGITTSSGNNLTTTSTSVTVNFGSTSGNVRVRAINNCGMSTARTKAVSFTCREAGTITKEEDILDAKVFPNPSSTDFTIVIENAEDQEIYIYVYDATGRLAKPVIEKAPSVVKINGLPAGIYSAVIKAKGYNKTFRLVKTE